MTPDGFLPESTISTYVNDPPDPQDDSFEVTYYSRLLSTYKMLENNLNALEQIMSHNGQSTQVILLEMPVAKGFYYFFGNGKNDHQHFINEVNRLARVRHIPFWQTNLLYMIPDDGWADYNHLNTKGAAILAVRHHLHEHENREDQGDPGERVRSKKADEIGLCHPDKRLDNEHHDCRQCKAEHRRCDWAGENARRHLVRG
jgi:hypothetical protein